MNSCAKPTERSWSSMASPSDRPHPFRSKYDGECGASGYCPGFKAGDLIIKLPVSALMVRHRMIWTGGQNRMVRYAHFKCYERAQDQTAIALWKSKQIPGDPPPDIQRAFDREGARLLEEKSNDRA